MIRPNARRAIGWIGLLVGGVALIFAATAVQGAPLGRRRSACPPR